MHLPETSLLSSQHGPPLSRRKEHANLARTSPQARFVHKVQHVADRPRFEDKNLAKMKQLAASAARIGLVFGAGGAAGVIAQRRGWLGARFGGR